MRARLPIVLLFVASVIAPPANAQVRIGVLSLFGRGTIPTPLPKPKNPVAPFVDPGVAHVVLIVLENEGPSEAEQQSFLIDRVNEGMLMTEYYAVAHPSQPNYVAMISGSIAGTNGDLRRTLHRSHLGDLIPNRWKVYAEDYPGSSGECADATRDGAYVRRHVPFLSFACVDCRGIVRLNSDASTRRVGSAPPPPRDVVSVTKALRDDIANGTLPAFALIIPNLEDDGHSPSNLANANDWLTRYFAPLLSDERFTKDTVFIVTFDEDEHVNADHPNRVYAVVWGDRVLHGTDGDVYDHEDLFLTIAALLHVAPLPETDEPDSRPISGIWSAVPPATAGRPRPAE